MVGYRPEICVVDFVWLKVWVVLLGGFIPASCVVDIDWLNVWFGL